MYVMYDRMFVTPCILVQHIFSIRMQRTSWSGVHFRASGIIKFTAVLVKLRAGSNSINSNIYVAQIHKQNTIHKNKHEYLNCLKQWYTLCAGLVGSKHSIKLHYIPIYTSTVPATTDSLNY
jgi:hypothetical protein